MGPSLIPPLHTSIEPSTTITPVPLGSSIEPLLNKNVTQTEEVLSIPISDNPSQWERAAIQAEVLRQRDIIDIAPRVRMNLKSPLSWTIPTQTARLTGAFIPEKRGAFQIKDVPEACVASFVDGSGTLPVFFHYKNSSLSPLHMGSLVEVGEEGEHALCDIVVKVLCDGSSPLYTQW